MLGKVCFQRESTAWRWVNRRYNRQKSRRKKTP